MKDVAWIDVGLATFAADQTNTFARFPTTTADNLSNAEETSDKTTLAAQGVEVTVKTVDRTNKTVVITSAAGVDLMFPMEAFGAQADEKKGAENVNWPRTTRTADALSIRSKHYYTTGI